MAVMQDMSLGMVVDYFKRLAFGFHVAWARLNPTFTVGQSLTKHSLNKAKNAILLSTVYKLWSN